MTGSQQDSPQQETSRSGGPGMNEITIYCCPGDCCHDLSETVQMGAIVTLVCSKCGITAIDIDLMEAEV